VCFFSAKALLISAIVIAKIVCLGFLVSHISGVAPIIWIFRVLDLFKSSMVSYVVFCLSLDSVLDLGLDFLSIFFIVKY
jgi:hypothetical protein